MKNTARIILTILTCLFLALNYQTAEAAWDGTVAGSYAGGTGTKANPYRIETEAQMAYFARNVNDGIGITGKYFALQNDIDMSSGGWSVTGSFDGYFDGMGHSVTLDTQFLPEIASGGTVRWLNICGSGTINNALFCQTNYGTIQGCSVNGAVVNGIALFCVENYGNIQSCYALGSLSVSNDAAIIRYNRDGGRVDTFFANATLSVTESGKYTTRRYGPIIASNVGSSSALYYSSLYNPTISDGSIRMTPEEMKTQSFADTLNESNPVPGLVWAWNNDEFPHLEECYGGYAWVGYDNLDCLIYNTNSFNLSFNKSDPVSTVYYTLDGSDPRSSATRKTAGASSESITGDCIVRCVAYWNGQYGVVRKQEIIQLLGYGTQNSPYRITTKAQLNAVRVNPDQYFILANDLYFTEEDFADGGAFAGGWVPIPNFSGTFNGKTHAIYGLQGKQGGFIGTNSGTVDSLRIMDHRLWKQGTCGAIANDNTNGTVIRCYAESAFAPADLPAKGSRNSLMSIGGIVGKGNASYSASGGLIYVTASESYNLLNAGGITAEGSANNCINRSQIYASASSITEYIYAGGISAKGSASNCASFAEVYTSLSMDYDQYIGVISGNFMNGGSYHHCVSNLIFDDHCTSGKRYADYGTYQSYVTSNYRFSSIPESDRCLQSRYPELDFEETWMMSAEGPVPQGVMDAEGHIFKAVADSYVEPDCESSGSMTWFCSACGRQRTEILPARGHDLTHHGGQAATCTIGGWEEYDTCSRCDYTNYAEIAALGHDITHHEAKAATCTEAGWEAYDDCSRCDYTTYVETTALGHDLTHHESKAATCTEAGWEAYDDCSRCDYTTYVEIDALGHNLMHHEAKSATCTEIGWDAYDTCSRCDYTTYVETAALGHDITHHNAKAATCTGSGWNAYDDCSRCDYTTYSEIAALGHSFDTENPEWVWSEDLSQVTVFFPCMRCDIKDEAEGVIWSSQRTEPTHADEGSIVAYAYCDYQGNNYDGQQTKVIEALGHSYGEAFWRWADDGSWASLVEQCSCGDERITEAAVRAGSTVAPTCTQNGQTTFLATATFNGQTKRDTRLVSVPALGHDLEHHNAQAPGCTEAGWAAYDTCTRCDYTSYEEIAALGHDWGEWDLTKHPSEAEPGLETRVCKNDASHKETRTLYAVILRSEDGGRVFASSDYALPGTEITVNAIPENGYRFVEWRVHTDGLEVTDGKFIMPEANAILEAVWEPIVYGICDVMLDGVTAPAVIPGHDFTVEAFIRIDQNTIEWNNIQVLIISYGRNGRFIGFSTAEINPAEDGYLCRKLIKNSDGRVTSLKIMVLDNNKWVPLFEERCL